jgi:ABC-type Na+ transport system ATPase subunit NatA
MMEISALAKRFGATLAVGEVSCTVSRGTVADVAILPTAVTARTTVVRDAA